MFRTRLLVILICLPLLSSCALHNAIFNRHGKSDDNASRSNWIRVYRIGLGASDIKEGIRIEGFDSDSAAKEAGMQIGDVIVSINGKKLSDTEFKKMMHFNKGENLLFTINRNGQMIDYNISPKLRFSSPPSVHKVFELLSIDKRKVSLAVIIADAKNNTNGDHASWEESVKQNMQGTIENSMLGQFGRDNNFFLVDRLRLDKILDEYKMNMSGLMSDDARTRIGKMTGATHLLIATLTRFPKDNDSCEDVTTARLIELESGKVLAIDQSQKDCK